MKKYLSNLLSILKYWLLGLVGGPGVSVVLQKWVIENPPPYLVVIIYALGFMFFMLTVFLEYKYKVKQVEFLKFMVHTEEKTEKPDGTVETKNYGRIDANSVEIVKNLKDLL